MSFAVSYHPLVVKEDIPKLGAAIRKRTKSAIETKLMTRPEVFGIPLRHSKSGDRKLRVGDYRVIFRIKGKKINIYLIEHRSVVYKMLMNRVRKEF
ncbi:MAG: type II toxin-antitoxin system RelE/ParE family toxin [Patescibacteria group bacterium]